MISFPSFFRAKRRAVPIIIVIITMIHFPVDVCAATISLPPPKISSNVMLDDVLSTGPRYLSISRDEPLSLSSITQLLWAGQGISHYPSRTVPSAGGTYPIDIFVTINADIPDTNKSTYHYLPMDHVLDTWIANDIFANTINSAIKNETIRDSYSDAPVLFTITAEYSRTTSKYGSRGIQYVQLEMGHLIQNFNLQARALDIHIEIVFEFNENDVQSILETEYEPMVLIFAWKMNEENDILGLNSESEIDIKAISSGISVEEAINERKSIREYLDEELTELEVSDLLDLSYYRRDPWTGNLVFKSITEVLPVNVYLSITRVKGIEEGIYNYDPFERRFLQLSNDSRRTLLWEQSLKQIWVLEAPIVLVWTINQTRLEESPWPGYLLERLSMLELGTIAQNIYLKSYSLGLGTVVVGAFSESGVRDAVFASINELPVYVQPIGKVTTILYDDFANLSIQWWASLFAWLSVSFFYLTCVLMTPTIRKKIKKWDRWLHLILGIFAVFFASLHLVLNHGGWFLLTNPTWKRLINFIDSLFFYISINKNSTANDIGLFIARIMLWNMPIFSLVSVYRFIKKSRGRSNKILRLFHKYSGYTTGIGIGLHSIINGVWISLFTLLIYFLLFCAAIFYIFIYNYDDIRGYFMRFRNNNENNTS